MHDLLVGWFWVGLGFDGSEEVQAPFGFSVLVAGLALHFHSAFVFIHINR